MSYQVLARKYRPQTFSDLIGQEVLVRTLSNAINSNRIAHAFMLTGIRGVGKTTTARIIAKGLNCIGTDGKGGPTPAPCGECSNCVAITKDQHQDIIEMDAASRTGVDDIREIIDNAYYLPTSARYKIYIIDEVHMLSKNAFNALLKTLEEPPEHVKFIFATTEIQKIPVTILSRCQRFDLKRVNNDTLYGHFEQICEKESVDIEEEAIQLIVNLSEGSVRDGLSLLDQAIALAEGKVTEEHVRSMLGLASNLIIADIFEALASGDTAKTLSLFEEQYQHGADPILLMQDLLSFCYALTQALIAKDALTASHHSEEEIKRLTALAEQLDMAYATRCWQMLLKGLGELKFAPDSMMAAKMVLVRIAYMAELPSPAKAIASLKANTSATPTNTPKATIAANTDTPSATQAPTTANLSTPSPAPNQDQGSMLSFESAKQSIAPTSSTANLQQQAQATALSQPDIQPDLEEQADVQLAPMPQDFTSMIELFNQNNEVLLYNWLKSDVKLVSYQLGHIEIQISSNLPSNFPYSISKHLTDWTGEKWVVSINAQAEGAATITEQEKQVKQDEINAMYKEPVVQNLLEAFPEATITSIEQTTDKNNSDTTN